MMTLLICLVGVALIACTKFFKGNESTRIAVSGGLGVLLLVLVVLRFTTCANTAPPPATMTVNRYWAVGWKFGTLVAEQISEGGKVIVLQSEPSNDILAEVAESQLAGLQHGLGEGSFEVVPRHPGFIRAMGPVPDASEERAGVDQEVMKEINGAAALVSFAQLPVSPGMKSKVPPVYLLDDFASGFWIPAMKAGVVQAAVTTHRDTSKIDFSKEDGSPQERFDAIYQVFTPENVETFK